jgi:hypothetical protein
MFDAVVTRTTRGGHVTAGNRDVTLTGSTVGDGVLKAGELRAGGNR